MLAPNQSSVNSGTGPTQAALTSAYGGLLFAGAIFGFFYAWVCSTMYGLDATDPRVAITAMNAINSEIQNAVFFPAFFLTPVALAIPAVVLGRQGFRRAAMLFGAAAVVYLVGGVFLTMAINVPMNRDLLEITAPDSIEEARVIWGDYSGRWQFWNTVRTVFSGLSLLLGAVGLGSLSRR